MTAFVMNLSQRNPRFFLIAAAALWWGLYQTLIPLSEMIVTALPVARESRLGGALQFFFYDTPKVLMLIHTTKTRHIVKRLFSFQMLLG
jgi:hypothetical protein